VAVTTFLTATNVDLNGDGRDEIAAVLPGAAGPAYGALVIAIFRAPRRGLRLRRRLLGTWSLNLNNWNGIGLPVCSIIPSRSRPAISSVPRPASSNSR
jgi:hypothetical protein